MRALTICLIAALGIFIILTPAVGVAQIEPGNPAGNIEYIPNGVIKWVLESTDNDEIVSVEKLSDKITRFTIEATDNLSASEKENYPIEIFRLEYDENGEISRRIDFDASTFGVLSFNRDIRESSDSLDITIPDTWKGVDLAHLYMKIGPNSSTYSAVTNTITIWDGTFSFDDIYNADVAGGWGVVSKQCEVQYCFDAKLIVGNGVDATTLADNGKQIQWTVNVITANGQKCIEAKNNTTMVFGTLVDPVTKHTRSGCSFTMAPMESSNGSLITSSDVFYLYSSSFISNNSIGEVGGVDRVYNCTAQQIVNIIPDENCNTYNLLAIDAATASTLSPGAVASNVTAIGCYYTLKHIGNHDSSISNVYVRDTQGRLALVLAVTSNSTITAINIDSDAWSFDWFSADSATFYRQYEFNLIVTDSGYPLTNATVSITDLNGTNVYSGTTSASGTIPQQTLNFGTYIQADGDTPTMQTPHTITISKAGYDTYESTWTMDEETSWTIAMITFGTCAGVGSSRGITSGEYEPGESGTIYAQIFSSGGTPTSTASVTYDMWDPGGNLAMSGILAYVPATNGIYEVAFTAPEVMGAYAIDVTSTNPTIYSATEIQVRTGNQWWESVIMFAGEILLLGLMCVLAFWRRELILYLAAAACAGMICVLWWEENIAYGLPALLLSGVMLWKFCWQLMSGRARF